jgi:hypothetical protein
MTFSLTVDNQAFEKHLKSVMTDFTKVGAQVIPVIKGNGYGFTRRTLAKESSKLNIKRIAIGTVYELDQTLTDFGDEVIVLEPFNPSDSLTVSLWEQAMTNNSHRVIAVIAGSHLAAASRVGIKKVLIEGKTSLHRFGLSPTELLTLVNGEHHNISVVGLNLHLPIADPVNVKLAQLESSAKVNTRKTSPRILEISDWLNNFASVFKTAGWPLKLNISHVNTKEVSQIIDIAAERNHDITVDVRLGTSLWLGNQKALKASGTVLEIHELNGDHEHVGYRQVDSHGNARLLIVSGGTSHGVAVAAPASRVNLRAKGVAIVEGFAQAFGKVRSPFKHKGKNLFFAEPPHMHVSLLWSDDLDIKVGDQLECTIRNTTANFDLISGLA